MRSYKKIKNVLTLILCVCMLFTQAGVVFAVESDDGTQQKEQSESTDASQEKEEVESQSGEGDETPTENNTDGGDTYSVVVAYADTEGNSIGESTTISLSEGQEITLTDYAAAIENYTYQGSFLQVGTDSKLTKIALTESEGAYVLQYTNGSDWTALENGSTVYMVYSYSGETSEEDTQEDTDVPDTPAVTAVGTELSAPATSKTITQLPDSNGEYTLSLGVTGAATSSSETQSKTVDIVLVLDVSGSMDEDLTSYSYTALSGTPTNSNGEYYVLVNGEYVRARYSTRYQYWFYTTTGNRQQRVEDGTTFYTRTESSTSKLAALKSAVNSFIDTAASAEGAANIQISIVKYAGNSSNSIGNQTYRDGRYTYNYSQIVTGLTNVSTGSDSLKSTVNSFSAGGATSADYGMAHASTVLQSSTADSKYVIMFTDGEPNHYSGFDSEVANDTYTVTETNSGAYKVTDDKGTTTDGIVSGTNAAGETYTVTNNKNVSSPTGLFLNYAPYILIVAAAGALAVVFFRRKRTY